MNSLTRALAILIGLLVSGPAIFAAEVGALPKVNPAASKPVAAAEPPDTISAPAPQPVLATGTYDLKYKFQAGETIRSRVFHTATVETTISGTTQTAETSSTSVKAWKVLDVGADGHITFEHSVESVDMRNRMSGRQEVRYNSAGDEPPPRGFEDAAKAVGRPLAVVTIDDRGNVLKREEKYAQPGAANTNTQLLMTLPAEPVQVGHVWTVPRDIDVALEGGESKRIKTRQRYELEKVVDGIATIRLETQILTPMSNPKIQVQLVQRLSKGPIRFDIEAGRVIGQQIDIDERVIAFTTPDSSMHYVTRLTEELLPNEQKTAFRDRSHGNSQHVSSQSSLSPAAGQPKLAPLESTAPLAVPSVPDQEDTPIETKPVAPTRREPAQPSVLSKPIAPAKK